MPHTKFDSIEVIPPGVDRMCGVLEAGALFGGIAIAGVRHARYIHEY